MKRRFFAPGEENSYPMLALFGEALLVLLIMFVLITSYNNASEVAADGKVDEGQFKLAWENNSEGFVVIAQPGKLFIVESQKVILNGDLCKQGSPFITYAAEKYSQQKKQLIFSILEGGERTFFLARNCLMSTFSNIPVLIGWIAANDDILKSVNLNDLPSYIKKNKSTE